RVPKGRDVVNGMITEDRPAGTVYSMLMQPVLDVSRTMTVTLDGRAAKPVSATVPRSGATQLAASLMYSIKAGHVEFTAQLSGDTFDGFNSAQLGPAGTTTGLVSDVAGQWGQVGAA